MSESKLYTIELGGDLGDIAAMHRLVRCKECVWGKAVEQVGCVRLVDRATPDGLTDPDGYCAWAEKMED